MTSLHNGNVTLAESTQLKSCSADGVNSDALVETPINRALPLVITGIVIVSLLVADRAGVPVTVGATAFNVV
jgi:hypothetical protein